jgi:acyl carrier protein
VDVNERIRLFLQDELVPAQTLGNDQDLIESDLLDSAGIVALLGFLETDLGVQIDETVDLVPDNFRTVAAIAGFVRRKAPSVEAA